MQIVWRLKQYSSLSLEEPSLCTVNRAACKEMHTLQKKDREQNPQPRCFCTSRRISLKSQLSGTECSPQPSSHREEQQGENKKIGTGRRADKLRITTPGTIIIMRANGLHLERSWFFESWGCGFAQKGSWQEPAPLYTPISIQALSKGAVTNVIPDLPRESHNQLQAALPYGAVPPHPALPSTGGGLNIHLSPKSGCFSA